MLCFSLWLQFTMPGSSFVTACKDVASCSSHPIVLSSIYYSPEGSGPSTLKNVISNYPNVLSTLPAVTLVSGALDVVVGTVWRKQSVSWFADLAAVGE